MKIKLPWTCYKYYYLHIKKFVPHFYLLSLIWSYWASATAGKEGITIGQAAITKRAKAFLILSKWTEELMEDFENDTTYELATSWIQNMPKNRFTTNLSNRLRKRKIHGDRENYIYYESDEDEGKEKLIPGKFGIMDLEPEMVAEQWRFLDMEKILRKSGGMRFGNRDLIVCGLE